MNEQIKTKQITVDQHYVPRFYMKNFGNIIGLGNKEKVLVSFYQFKGCLIKENISTKSICYEKYFYGENGLIENDFAQRETNWALTINNIVNTNSYILDKHNEDRLKEFSVFQYNRTLATYKFGKKSITELLTTHIMNNTEEITEKTIIDIVKDRVNNEIKVSDMIESCDDTVRLLDDLEVSIIEFSTIHKLITSDMPVLIINPLIPKRLGIVNIGIVIIFPVSLNKIVVIYDKKIYEKLKPYMIISNEDDVINLNKYQLLSAEERIISHDLNDLKEVISNNELLNQRDQLKAKQNISSSFDGEGTFFAVHTRNITYNYQLSFCSLPSIFKKIPHECREIYARKYSDESWIKSLVCAYRIPYEINTIRNLSPSKLKKLELGYKEMNKFMENYWEIPMSDRTITPKMMEELKTLDINYYPININNSNKR